MSTFSTTGTRVLRTTPVVAGGGPSPAGGGTSASGISALDMIEPVLVLVDLAPHGREVGLLDGLGHGAGLADDPVVDRADGHHLGRRPGEERLLGQVQVRAQEVAL